MKKRICFVDQTLNGGGAERVACTIIRGLPAELFDIHLVILSSPGDLIDIIPEHVDIHILNARSTKSAILPFFKAIQSISPDIIFTTTHRTNILSALTGILFRKTKTVGRCPNMISTEAELDETALPLPLISFFYSKMDCIIAQTHQSRRGLCLLILIICFLPKDFKISPRPFHCWHVAPLFRPFETNTQ